MIFIVSVPDTDVELAIHSSTELIFEILSLFLGRYKKDPGISFLATCTLHNLLNAALLPENGPPLLDFEVASPVFPF